MSVADQENGPIILFRIPSTAVMLEVLLLSSPQNKVPPALREPILPLFNQNILLDFNRTSLVEELDKPKPFANAEP